MNGISSVTDSPRPAKAHRVVKPVAIAAVEVNVKIKQSGRVNRFARNLEYIEK
jgi:hypothetical protein